MAGAKSPQGKKPSNSTESLWHPLYLLSLYRVAQALMLIALAPSVYTLGVLGKKEPQIYLTAAVFYLIAAVLILVTVRRFRQGFLLHLYLQFFCDLLFITSLLHSSGGVRSGLGVLLVVGLLIQCLMVRGIVPYFLAAMVTIVILIEELYADVFTASEVDYVFTALHGVVFFAVAWLAQLFNRRISESETLANQRFIALGNLEQLNNIVVEQVQSGIVVVSQQQKIVLINQQALRLLNRQCLAGAPLADLSPLLSAYLQNWQLGAHPEHFRLENPGSPYALQVEFSQLPDSRFVLLDLRDTSLLSKELQAQKLASLGRLTASIAHEIRNPLSAIQHAAQLLAEAELSAADMRLTNIIEHQTTRLNRMVENIMQLSKKNQAIAETIELPIWLASFKNQFVEEMNIDHSDFELEVAQDLQGQFDKTQLQQVLWNLCANSLKYGKDADGKLKIFITATLQDGYIELQVRDSGSGIDEEIVNHIFEPFFTARHNIADSTGLGLFIAHELCEMNHGELYYQTGNSHQPWYFAIHIPIHLPHLAVDYEQ